MCADRAHAGVTKWVGKIPPESMDRPGSSGPMGGAGNCEDHGEQAKGKQETMKKLMIAAAVAALTAGAFAAACSEDPEPECDSVVFTVKYSGKTADQTYDKKGADKGYASVQKISGKGTLVISDYATELLTAKVGKYEVEDGVLLVDGEVIKWSYFGKDLAKASGQDAKSKPGKTYTLESDLGIVFEGQDEWDVSVTQVAFGKVKVKLSKGGTVSGGACGEDTEIEACIPALTPKSYSGWFTGWFSPFCMDAEGYDDGCAAFPAAAIM